MKTKRLLLFLHGTEPMKRKVVLLVGYNGAAFHGLQWNNDTHTIERTVLSELLNCGLVTALNAEDPQKVDLKSASRTDRGVHASFNVLTVKITEEPTESVFNKLKEALAPHAIHLYRMIKVPRRFIAHKSARSRIYSYTVPTAVLRTADLKEEARQLAAGDGREIDLGLRTDSASSIECENNGAERTDGSEAENNTAAPTKNHEREYCAKTIIEAYKNGTTRPLGKNKETKLSAGLSNAGSSEKARDEAVRAFTDAVKAYIGTHNFKNFTVTKATGGPVRYIRSVDVGTPFIKDGVEYIEVVIHGQSFLLHQIRKMMSFAVLLVRYFRNKNNKINELEMSGSCPSDKPALNNGTADKAETAAEKEEVETWVTAPFKKVFSEEVHIPKAPSEYLFLRNIFFDDFNTRAETPLEIPEEERRLFEESTVWPAVLQENNLVQWERFLDAVRFHWHRFPLFL